MKTLLLITLLAIASRLFAQNDKTTPEEKPNILLILSDDHSYPYLGCYGNPDLKTPNLDQLAGEGILFNHAYTAAPQCVPSRAAIMSGRSVVDIRMSRFSAPLPREIKTIPEYLSEVGYYTGICGRHYHLDGSMRKPEETIAAFEKYNLVTFPDRVDYLHVGADDEVKGKFQEFLGQVPEGKPFFMWMNFSDPHRPFTADEYEPNPETLTVPSAMPDEKELRKDLAEHYGEINHLDFYIGEIIAELEKQGLKENTLILFMGDNGAALLRGKGTLYDMGLHVPLIAHWPEKIKKFGESNALISGEDIAPTIIEVAGAKIGEDITGKSFFPVLKNEKFEEHNLIYGQRVPHSSGLPKSTSYFDLSRTVFSKKYKLIYNALWQLPYNPVDFGGKPIWKELKALHEAGDLATPYDQALFAEPRHMFQLFDREKDPEEFNNLIGNPEYAEIEKDLKARLHEWMIVYQDYLPLPIEPPKKKKH